MADEPQPFDSYSKETVYDTLKDHHWDIRAAARTLGIPYRKLEHYRREHNLYAHTDCASLEPSGVESSLAGLVPLPFHAPVRESFEPLYIWAKRRGLSYETACDLRDQNRLFPLYRHSESKSIETIDYAFPSTEVCPPSEHNPPYPLEGYESLHSLEVDNPVLGRLARILIDQGRLHPLPGSPPLFREAQLTWLRALQQTGPQTDSEFLDAEGLEADYLESLELEEAPGEVQPSPRAPSEGNRV